MGGSETKRPERIVSLLASATEILYGLGLGERVVAISHECDFPAEAATKPRVTKTLVSHEANSAAIDAEVRQMVSAGDAMYSVDADALNRLSPDLIVTQSHCDVCAVRYDDVVAIVEGNSALAKTQVVDLDPKTLGGVLADVRRVGGAAGVDSEAERYVSELQRRIKSVTAVSGTIADANRPRVLCIEWIAPLMVAANWMPELLEMAGGRCDLTHAGSASTSTEWDDIIAFDPERIVVMPCGFDLPRAIDEAKVLAELVRWRELSAVRTGNVFATDGNAYFNRSGPRLVESLEILAHLIHPDLFAAPSTPGATPFRRLDALLG